MRKIYKYRIGDNTPGSWEVQVPVSRELLSVRFDLDKNLCAWFIVDDDSVLVFTSFHVYFTGEECHESPHNWVNTCDNGEFVFHIFYRP